MQGNFSETEGVVGITCWFEKLELAFRVSKVEDSDNVKYATCTMLDGALTRWNLYVQTVEMVTPEASMIESYIEGLN
uniref:Reverse transcriptase domain-containing protein n=1 Tax=Tanacetum cinerariifolium TaxID=118510 RepID=A0A699RHJ1_TANCI|nr:hypothetical protein [Tanacetum cinerariifolium]